MYVASERMQDLGDSPSNSYSSIGMTGIDNRLSTAAAGSGGGLASFTERCISVWSLLVLMAFRTSTRLATHHNYDRLTL
jgi:hypothetical protein